MSSSDPLRPGDHADSTESESDAVNAPALGVVGWLRFAWRQLTSMRTALVLLLLLALAAIPGSLVPQISADPNGVVQYKARNPVMSQILDSLGVFSTYTSVWFSAIYILLFISLIGCVIPRTKHHLQALRARPPRTPARLSRLEAFETRDTDVSADEAVDSAARMLRKMGYRIERYTSRGAKAPDSVSAERGYARETGNLIFHGALVGVLVAMGFTGALSYNGQKVIAEGESLVNLLTSYDSFNPGRLFNESMLTPYSVRLDKFDVSYEQQNLDALGLPTDYSAYVTVTEPDGQSRQERVRVNEPLSVDGTNMYLLGNGYAPTLVIRDPQGNVVFNEPTPFLPQDSNLFSTGVVKIPSGLTEQVGITGLFYPTVAVTPSGAYASSYPDLVNPVMTLEVYTGDLGLNDGGPNNAYALQTDTLTRVAGRDAPAPTIELKPGERVDLPNGLGSVELATDIPRFASLEIHWVPLQSVIFWFAVLGVAGLILSLFVPRRRVWVKAVTAPDGTVTLEYAGLARGDDPGLESAIADVAERHRKLMVVS